VKQVQYWLALAIVPLVLASWTGRVLLDGSKDLIQTSGVHIQTSDPAARSGFPETSETTHELFVQDPGKRSALRPDYSTAFRNSNFRNNYFMLQAFKDALSGSWQSTVQLVCDGQQCAMGTIVDSDGWIVTKASELDLDLDIDCILCDQREFRAEVISTFSDLDLALLRIPAEGLPAVE
jgi:S1-C subfamily serine protease